MRGGGAYRLRRMLRRQRRAIAAGLTLVGAALATTGLGGAEGDTAVANASVSDASVADTSASDAPPVPGAVAGSGRRSGRLVSAPVRIADPATVRLLRPGDRVDVIAVGDADDDARLVARDVRVAQVPGEAADSGDHLSGGAAVGTGTVAQGTQGALVVLSVERSTATALIGAGGSGRLAVVVSDAN
ncbi:hypothetical protein [Streptomyces sp. NPDC007346]|uniref:hypothetical protein n=1 Tax=Streptomyces sp. NPDC007346 TaxID=3154682 RepID=UPI0034551839